MARISVLEKYILLQAGLASPIYDAISRPTNPASLHSCSPHGFLNRMNLVREVRPILIQGYLRSSCSLIARQFKRSLIKVYVACPFEFIHSRRIDYAVLLSLQRHPYQRLHMLVIWSFDEVWMKQAWITCIATLAVLPRGMQSPASPLTTAEILAGSSFV